MSGITVSIDFDEARVDEIFAQVDQSRFPGAAIGIAIDGEPVYRKAFGLASMELPVVLSPATRMRIGSISKQFAALAFMLLCEDGVAGLDDSIGEWLPELHPVAHDATMRQLLGHIGGMRDVFDIAWALSGTGRHATSADLLEIYRDIDDLNAPPGTEWNYCNGGYLIVGTVIERLTGQPLEHVLRERIFTPLGMSDTMLRRFDTDFVPNSATLHTPGSAGGFERSYLGTAIAGEGGIVSTVDDMLRWMTHMDAPVIGSLETWATMKTPQTLANGASTGYGLGLITDRYRGVGTLSHTGGVMGGNAQVLKVPEAGLDIVIMLNRGDVVGALLVNGVLDSCLSGLRPPAAPQGHPMVTGTFRSPATGRVIQFSGDDEAQIISIDGEGLPIEYDGSVFSPVGAVPHTDQTFRLIGDDRRPDTVELSSFGTVDRFHPVPPADMSDPEHIAGRYRSESTGTDVIIRCEHGEPQMASSGRFGSVTYPLVCVADGIWRAKPAKAWIRGGGILSFDDDSTSFRLSRPRTRPLLFRRQR